MSPETVLTAGNLRLDVEARLVLDSRGEPPLPHAPGMGDDLHRRHQNAGGPRLLAEKEDRAWAGLESVRPEKNRYRWYTVGWWPTLWDTTCPATGGSWAMRCEWGRGVTLRECTDCDEALAAEVIERRLRRGYRVIGV